MKVVALFDKFKECITSREAALAALEGVKQALPAVEAEYYECADGGDGMTDVILSSGIGAPIVVSTIDALGRPIEAIYAFDSDNSCAFIDMASAAGLKHIPAKERNPMLTTTFGVGRLLLDAIHRGANNIYLGLGGSATNDAGLGILQALGGVFRDECGGVIANYISGSYLNEISSFDLKNVCNILNNINVCLLCDVNNPFAGKKGAVAVYASQKGADAEMLRQLESGMLHIGNLINKHSNRDVFSVVGGGAAGGVGGGLAALIDAEIYPGAETILHLIGAESAIANADIIITGEGHSDVQTLCGKLPVAVMRVAKKYAKPVVLMSGRIDDYEMFLTAGFSVVREINKPLKYNLKLPSGNPLSADVAKKRLACHAHDIFMDVKKCRI